MEDKQIAEAFQGMDGKIKSIDEKIAQTTKMIDDRLAKALEQLTVKEDLGPYMNISAREIYAAHQKRSSIEKLQTFRGSDLGKMTSKNFNLQVEHRFTYVGSDPCDPRVEQELDRRKGNLHARSWFQMAHSNIVARTKP